MDRTSLSAGLFNASQQLVFRYYKKYNQKSWKIISNY